MHGNIKDFRKTIITASGTFGYYDLREFKKEGIDIEEFPFSIRILLENILRNQNGISFTSAHLDNIMNWKPSPLPVEIPFMPSRVLMQDFTGVPSIVDLASIRSEAARRGKDPNLINPLIPVDLIIDHSVQVDYYGTKYAYQRNVDLEYERNQERYALLKWAQSSFKNFNVLPPGMGICHQVNLEYLADVATTRDGFIFPDTLVGTDSHTPMINGIGVAGWGVGGIEAEAAMLGQPMYLLLPEVIGLKLTGRLKEGVTSTDLVLSVAELLRKKGVVNKFVEVFGSGLENLSVPDRSTISNMSPEFGCTITYFPPDLKTLEYLRATGRSEKHISTVEGYLKSNLLWRVNEEKIKFTDVIELDMGSLEASVAGPKRPQDKVLLTNLKDKFIDILRKSYEREYIIPAERSIPSGREDGSWLNEGGQTEKYVEEPDTEEKLDSAGIEVTLAAPKRGGLKTARIKDDISEYLLSDGAIVVAAITSCTNTSNPSVMIGAGLVAKKAIEKGLQVKPWVKTSMAPGSRVVTTYLDKSGLTPFLDALGFHTVGYGCTTCIGNSGPLPLQISKAVTDSELIVSAVLSGNRNFEARIHPLVKMNFLASPLLVVAYAIAGRIDINLLEDPIGLDQNLEPVYLKDIWPSSEEIHNLMNVLDHKDYEANYKSIYQGDEKWKMLETTTSNVYDWNDTSSYIRESPFFRDISTEPEGFTPVRSARVLLKLGDSITTDHISPAGTIGESSPAGKYLKSLGIESADFNSYGARRGNHEVMIRGTFANVRLRNELVEYEGGMTVYHPTGHLKSVYDASLLYRENKIPLIILAGKEYGSGSSRDWAAKGASLLGVRVIIAESFERIHRSNLVGMGVMPLQFKKGETRNTLELKGDEVFEFEGLEEPAPNKEIIVTATRSDGSRSEFSVVLRIDSLIETLYLKNGGILQYVLRAFLKKN